jgi:hypothetical protein
MNEKRYNPGGDLEVRIREMKSILPLHGIEVYRTVIFD